MVVTAFQNWTEKSGSYEQGKWLRLEKKLYECRLLFYPDR